MKFLYLCRWNEIGSYAYLLILIGIGRFLFKSNENAPLSFSFWIYTLSIIEPDLSILAILADYSSCCWYLNSSITRASNSSSICWAADFSAIDLPWSTRSWSFFILLFSFKIYVVKILSVTSIGLSNVFQPKACISFIFYSFSIFTLISSL